MKKILGLGVVALLVMALVGGGTWAYFSDVETSSNNILSAGTLDLKLTGGTASGDSVTGTFSQSGWYPGGTKQATLTIKNNGSLSMTTASINFTYGTNASQNNGLVDTTGRPTNISGSPWTTNPTDYFDKMIEVTAATWNGTVMDGATGNSTFNLVGKTLYELRTAGNIPLHKVSNTAGVLSAGAEAVLNLTFSFNASATNGCQGNVATMNITVVGNQ